MSLIRISNPLTNHIYFQPFKMTENDDPFKFLLKLNRSNFYKTSLSHIKDIIKKCFRHKKFRRLNFNIYGKLVLFASRSLLARTQKELMEPLGVLSKAMENYDIENIKEGPDWTKLKREQRARILRDYWEKVRKRKTHMQKLSRLYPRSAADQTKIGIHNTGVISEFCKPFSAAGDSAREFSDDLIEILKAGISRQLPWRQMIIQQIFEGKKTFDKLTPVISDQKKDRAFKLQILMEMAQASQIDLIQEKCFGDIHFNLMPKTDEFDTGIVLKDKHGRRYCLDWCDLHPNQRGKVVEDLRDNKIVLA
jgi:hypothetical protein